MPEKRPKVLVAMSGGVDSSVAAAMLLRDGYDVVGCFMRLGSPGESLEGLAEVGGDDSSESCPTRIGHQGCCSINDAADARLVAAKLGIPFYVCNFKKDFGRIIDYFVGEYNAGRTPNPCVRCNDWLKFGRLHEYARQIGADFVASGHYARIEEEATEARRHEGTEGGIAYRLLRGVDQDKDQSYVLFGMPRERLGEMLLPIGGLKKSRVREIAAELDLPVFDKPDSQEICFVPDNDYAGLVRRRTPRAVSPGRIIDSSGDEIGEHDGHQHFTIGQRRGLGIARGYPLYVIDKDAAANTVTVGERSDLCARGCIADEVNWLVEPADGDWLRCTAKIRYNAAPVAARARRLEGDALEVRFDEPQHAVAPGQAVVCYDGETVRGGGWIREAIPGD
ncbi:MAG: tRNA 2-thiouridine(34) synthase MnmA [Planctomycetota bacterium]|jgi:tRNA-specific 2-thiouridylase